MEDERLSVTSLQQPSVKTREVKLKEFLFLALLTVGAMFVHGYHPWAEDAAIYIPSLEKVLNQRLFPFNAQFFESHAHLTLFAETVATSIRVFHLSLPYALFVGHVVSIFLLLFACWELAGMCIISKTGRYAAVVLLAALLTLPVAGTALYVMDQYLNPRNVTAFVGILAISRVLDRKHVSAALLLLLGATIHPLMSTFAISFCILLFCLRELSAPATMVSFLMPFGFLDPPSVAYHQVAVTHPYFYPLRWQWFEWLGVIGPIVILWWFGRIARSRQMKNLELMSRTLVFYQIVFVIAALAVSVPPRFESLARLQPMRSLYLLYILFILFCGGLLGEFLLKDRWWRWLVMFVPLCGGMFYVQKTLFPASAHVEWPGSKPRNLWVQAFEWTRENTPPDAIFALDPYFMHIPGEDENSFRAITERSSLADGITDSGAVTMFPRMADEWLAQMQAQRGWQRFQVQDFHRLRVQYGVNWVVLRQPGVMGLQCLYQNGAVKVCKVD